MKNKLLIIFLALLLFITGMSVVAVSAMEAEEIYKRIDHRPQDIIQYEHNESLELNSLVQGMFEEMNREDTFNKNYINYNLRVNEEDVKLLGNVLYNEVRGSSDLDKATVAWVVLNRCDRDNLTIKQVVSIPKQFAYKPNMKLKSEKAKSLLRDCEKMARDVLTRHLMELDGIEDVGRTIPNNYFSFWGDGVNTHFRTTTGVYEYWDFKLGNPYEK